MPDAWLLPGIVLAIIQLLAYVLTRKFSQTVTSEKNPLDHVDTEKNLENKQSSQSKISGK